VSILTRFCCQRQSQNHQKNPPLFAVSHSFAESEGGAESRANTAELLTQLRLLDEMEEISIKNIL